MEQENNGSSKNLSFIRSKILTLKDVFDFCQKEGKLKFIKTRLVFS